jgi:hypothetical protein
MEKQNREQRLPTINDYPAKTVKLAMQQAVERVFNQLESEAYNGVQYHVASVDLRAGGAYRNVQGHPVVTMRVQLKRTLFSEVSLEDVANHKSYEPVKI